MGSVACHRLQQAGFSVAALYHQHPAASLQRQLITPQGVNLHLELPLHTRQTGAAIQRLLVATKGGDTVDALEPWLPLMAENGEIILLQNGLHTLRGLLLPPRLRLIYWVTTDGAWKQDDQVHWVAENESWLGDGHGQPADWFAALATHWPRLQWVTDIAFWQWRKLAVNAVINPLTALHRCRNGQLLQQPEYRQQMQQLAAEVDQVAGRKFPHWPADTLARSVQVCEQTANNRSSMLVDVEAGRATEIAFINGALLAEAQQLGIALPAHQNLLTQLAGE